MIVISLTGTANIDLFDNSEHVIAVKFMWDHWLKYILRKLFKTLMMLLQLIIRYTQKFIYSYAHEVNMDKFSDQKYFSVDNFVAN